MPAALHYHTTNPPPIHCSALHGYIACTNEGSLLENWTNLIKIYQLMYAHFTYNNKKKTIQLSKLECRLRPALAEMLAFCWRLRAPRTFGRWLRLLWVTENKQTHILSVDHKQVNIWNTFFFIVFNIFHFICYNFFTPAQLYNFNVIIIALLAPRP